MNRQAIVIGGGPAGLMAAETLLAAGIMVDLYESMPSLGRKFLMAGRGGLNITHSEPLEHFIKHYGNARERATDWINAFGPQELRDWVHGLGIKTFIGTSGRVFPAEMKAAPLLRSWLYRLRQQGLRIHVRHRWIGWSADDGVIFEAPASNITVRANPLVLALGGGSWPQLGSDGAWQNLLRMQDIDLAALEPSNCGFDVSWSDHMRHRFPGAALKNIGASFNGATCSGEAIITEHGIEGGLIYALTAPLRKEIAQTGQALLYLDLLPNHIVVDIATALAKRGSRSLSSYLKSSLRLSAAKVALVYECLVPTEREDPATLAAKLKALPLRLTAPRPIAEAISTAGGVKLDALDDRLMVKARPGVFCAGEMLDWEAPTGGYLLTACYATGLIAGKGAAAWLTGDMPS